MRQSAEIGLSGAGIGEREPVVTLRIPRVAPSPNQYVRAHWRRYETIRKHWIDVVWVALCERGVYGRPAIERAGVAITRQSSQLLDPDNLVGSCKPILDALRRNGAIRDDDPAHLCLVVLQQKGPAQTMIEIWDES